MLIERFWWPRKNIWWRANMSVSYWFSFSEHYKWSRNHKRNTCCTTFTVLYVQWKMTIQQSYCMLLNPQSCTLWPDCIGQSNLVYKYLSKYIEIGAFPYGTSSDTRTQTCIVRQEIQLEYCVTKTLPNDISHKDQVNFWYRCDELYKPYTTQYNLRSALLRPCLHFTASSLTC